MLRVTALSVRFRRHDGSHATALSGLELTLARGEVIGLVGGSGAGKSLVAEALMGLLPGNAEVSGQITRDGQRLAPGQLALAPQGIDALDPLTRLGDQICRFARLAGQPPPDLPASLARLGLPETAARAFPHELSGGMAKRALIATALATGAGFLIADEPTLGLDPETADRILALLAGLAAQGHGVCVISHDLPRLIAIAGRITILQEGRMVETAMAGDFTGGHLRHPFSRALWAAQSWTGADLPC
ncbi:ATP-binding cassette domain-containing protein [Rhodobacter capsulatus]|uniref:Peptide/nickel transport system ATP-binding protein n=1 Tax=Rhodobacter capsulatus TaxID=1061 RepID=A0A1G7EMK6_RHOCA|nr:ATP-binding cassette domain-containing protein [Rhodobacter capsulatus]WER09496.1 ATP-binding cassette domain-containing protein [Rhodobacter capsulatus]SDE64686.1 peptide/nickel transport system ATP-binding protein [Rhodobacter capsulatus]